MIYITTTNYKEEFIRTAEKLRGLLNYYANLSKIEYSLECMIKDIDKNQEQLYYGIVIDDILAILNQKGPPKYTLSDVRDYIDNLL